MAHEGNGMTKKPKAKGTGHEVQRSSTGTEPASLESGVVPPADDLELPLPNGLSAIKPHISPFEAIRRTNEYGQDYWSSREMARQLGYREYRNFEPVLEKAKLACKNSDHNIYDHFVDSHEMIRLGKNAKREMEGVQLSRYACYLVIQNAHPSKDIVALGQTYFAVQTRRQELSEERDEQAIEDQRRLILRTEMREHNIQLADAAKGAGVVEPVDYAIFQNHGYQGLYGGLGAKEIHARKGLKKSQEILDHMGSAELAANLFRATQTEQKIRREGISEKADANRAHEEVGKKVRQTIKELGGTMPEELPAVESIKMLERRERKNKGAMSDSENE